MPAELAEEGERVRDACTDDCKDGCAKPDDCWSREPDVDPENETVWTLVKLFESKWDWGAAGYRCAYNEMPLLTFACHATNASGYELLDIIERVRVIEGTVIAIEAERYEADKEKREREATRNRLLAK